MPSALIAVDDKKVVPQRPPDPDKKDVQVLGAPGGAGSPRDPDGQPLVDADSAAALDKVFAADDTPPVTPSATPPAPTTDVVPVDLEVPPPASPPADGAPGFDEARFDAETQRMAQDVRPDRKSQETFQRLRNEIKELNREKARLVQEGARKADAAPPADVEALQAKLAEAEDRLGRIDLTQSQGFRKEFVQPLERMETVAAAALQRFASEDYKTREAALAAVQKVLNAPPEEQKELLQDFPVALQTMFMQLVPQYDEIRTARDAAVTNWKAKTAAMSEQERRSHELTLSRQLAESVDAAVDALRGARNLFFTPRGDAQHDADVEARVKEFRGVMETGDMGQIARLVAEGMAYRAVVPMYRALRDSYEKLRVEAQNVTKIMPSLGTRGDPGNPGPRRIETPDDVEAQIWNR